MVDHQDSSDEPTAGRLKKELRESLEILKKDFESLTHLMAELASDGTRASISLTNDDLNDLISVTREIQDAANDIQFEAKKIGEKLSRFIA
jgi:uncharacterized protein with von Willebrand factor type A (vWA) domain